MTTSSTGWTEGTSVSVENVDATKYLYAYATNGDGLESDVVLKEFNITKAKLPADLSYATTAYSIYADESFTAPDVQNPNSLTGITYALTGDAGVATVNSETGAVTLDGGAGTVTITASVAAQGDYLAGNASYTLTVNAVPTLNAVTEKTWNFSDKTAFPNQTLTARFFGDDILINATPDKTVSIASSRLELGGAGAANSRNITFKVAGKCRISVTAVSSNSSAERTLNVDYGTFGTNLGTIAAPKSAETNSIDYTTDAETTIIIYSTSGGIHVSKIVVEPLEVSITTAKDMVTFCSTKALNFEGKALTPYVISDISTSAVTLTAVTDIPATTGVILKGTAGTYSIPVGTAVSLAETNKLVGVTEDTEISKGGTYDYVLSNGKFVRAANGTLHAGKAYLPAGEVTAPELNINFDDTNDNTTGIENVESARSILDGEFYNIAGQRVGQLTKGLYIVNGKKVIIK